MADTFTNDLRLRLQESGANSGQWGTLLNTTISNIASAFSLGSETIPNASTHTITLADGTADEARSMYLKCTGGGQACTVTLAPNTISKVWIISNETSFTLTFTQGSGANVAVGAGAVKMIVTDGAGSGAAVTDALSGLEGAFSKVGIGTSSPDELLHLTSTTASVIRLERNDTTISSGNTIGNIEFEHQESGGAGLCANFAVKADTGAGAGAFVFETGSAGALSEKVRITSTGVGIGTTTVNADLHLGAASPHIDIGPSTGNRAKVGFDSNNVYIGSTSGTGEIHFKNNIGSTDAPHSSGDTKMVITDGSVLIGKTTPTDLHNTWNHLIIGEKGAIISENGAGGIDGMSISDNAYIDADTGAYAYQTTGAASIIRQTAGITQFANAVSGSAGAGLTFSETMRISGGNLLVGKTSTSIGDAGHTIFASGEVFHTVAGTPLYVNRTGSDGAIQNFYKDGTTVGSINSKDGDLAIGNGDCGIRFNDGANAVIPFNITTNSQTDNTLDLGFGSLRWQDVFATNGTINTSDRNEKQNIEALSDAEQRVAVAAKGLMRKYRWKSAVAEKGDDSRIHVGIIAQDLQDAFTAEGLDARRYAMFCSDTWTNDDGSEQTRLGVRYSELLAFIISAI